MSGHTPGPWKMEIFEHGRFSIEKDGAGFAGGLLVIADRGEHPKRAAEMHANAALIAAAPELLAAGKLVISWWDKYASQGPYVPAIEDAEWDQFRKLRSAIAKAEGNNHD